MSKLPVGYNPYGLQPTVIISDSSGNEKYRFESFGDVKDFELVHWDIVGAINTDHGTANIAIRDDDGSLLDDTKKRSPKIIPGDQLTIDLGKDMQSMERWFGGVVLEPAVQRPAYGLQDILVKAFGWGIYTAHRTAVLTHSQRLNADGLAYDPTDANSHVDAIFKRLLSDAALLTINTKPLPNFDLSAIDASDVLVPELHHRYQTVGAILAELANYADSVYGIDPNREAFMHLRGSKDSGFLATNDVENPTRRTRDWNMDKFMLILTGSPSYKDSAIGTAYSHLIGVGAQHLVQGYEATASNATRVLHTTSIAIPITPHGANIRKVTPFMAIVGAPAAVMIASVIGADDTGAPNSADIRQTILISADRLNRELAQPGWFGLLFEKIEIAANETVYLVFDGYPDSANYPTVDYQTGTGTYYTNVGGVWAQQVGQIKLREFAGRTIHIIGQNTGAAKRFNYTKESVIPMYDLPDQATALAGMEGMLNTLAHQRRICDPVVCSVPTARPPLGQTIRIYDSHNGADYSAELMGYSLSADVDDPQNLGATQITLFLEVYG